MNSLTVKDIINKVDTSNMMTIPLSDWRSVLAGECQVYVFGENYLAKRFDQINFKFCEKNEAREVLIDNLYALLRFKYFPVNSEEVDDRINRIVGSFTANLKTTLKKVAFDKNSDADIVKLIPDYCVAFRNGVFNFKDNKWLFKYNIIKLDSISNNIYMYDTSYIIQWYLDYDFESLDIDLNDIKLKDFISIMKESTKENRNYCFELLYNISHDSNDKFDLKRFEHLCQVLGYTLLQSFSQYFVLLIGSGQNGKNSLFDGCFTNRVIPRPASNDLDSIENDRFITGSLENKAHNIFLETSAKTYNESKMLKALTGSMYQTIEQKGVSKYSGVINCKYIFAGNDQDKIKFSDNTTGFRRRINMFEIFYHWDSEKRFMKYGDYYDTTFSDSLVELKNDSMNTTIYVYFAMYGIIQATNNFKLNFKFTKNDWSDKYSDIDETVKENINNFTISKLISHLTLCSDVSIAKYALYDENKKLLQSSSTLSEIGYRGSNSLVDMLSNDDACSSYFAEHDIYINLRFLQGAIRNISTPTAFTQMVKKIYKITKLENLHANQPYIKCTFVNKKLKIINKR